MNAQMYTGVSDVLVIGAGPAGSAAATVLAREGVDVVVVDRARFPRDKVCGDAVSNGAMDLIDSLGASEDVRSQPHAVVTRGVAVFPNGARVGRNYVRPGYIMPRVTLDESIKRAAERAGARVLEGVAVRELILNGRRLCGARGPQLDWKAKVVIAADGYGSIGLSALGRDKPHGRLLGVSSTVYVRGMTYPDGPNTADHFFEHELPCGYGWIFPEVDGVANVGVYLREDTYRDNGVPLSKLLASFMARHPERFEQAESMGKARTWLLSLAPVPGAVAGHGLILAGDAGGFIDPLSGEGIWQALHTGIHAGRVAAKAVAGGGELTSELVADFEGECARSIWRPSRAKAITQDVMRQVIRTRLYRLPPLIAALRWAYQRRSFEMTKA
jgi:geranylgeranyl reductase family protein